MMKNHFNKCMLLLLLFVLSFSSLIAQFTVSGTITDSSGETMIGANIIEKGTNNGNTTDIDGKYSISVTDGAAVLEISYTGYQSISIPVDGRSTIDVVLREGAILDEVVVSALGFAQKRTKQDLLLLMLIQLLSNDLER